MRTTERSGSSCNNILLECCPLHLTRRDTESLLDCSRVINFAVFDHGRDLVDIANVLGGIAVDEHHVGEFSRGDHASILLAPMTTAGVSVAILKTSAAGIPACT